MWIPRIVEAHLAEDWISPFTGETFKKGEAKVLLTSELIDKEKGNCLIALPNPVPAYLSIVEDSLVTAKSIRDSMYGKQEIFPDKPGTQIFTDIRIPEFDQFFQVVTALTVFSFIALEAWCNQMIPEDYIYTRHKPDKQSHSVMREEKLDKTKIERWVSLDEKLIHILPSIVSKPHFKSDVLWQRYKRANTARDEFTHLKSPAKIANDKTNYDPFFQRVLNLDLDDIATLPKDIMTYFVPKNLGF